ncbi:MAG: regulatory protein [Frondihabitans sp.]|nr:regulatory protein [Frondihabitans sp.]
MAAKIALFNHKGGVSKTTTTFNLGWMLASQGARVVIVDADPQCNLTGMVLGYRGPTELETLYRDHPERNIKAALAPAFESQPRTVDAVDCIEVDRCERLFLLPGHVGLAENEVTLGIAQELSGSIQALQNLPGAISWMLDRTAEHHNADFVLVDMSPGLGAINQNLFATSDYFIVPTNPDFFSVMAIDSLSNVIPRWQDWASRAAENVVLRDAAYPFPAPNSRFLGTVIQKFRPRKGAPSAAFAEWITEIQARIDDTLLPALDRAGMLLDRERYTACGIADDYTLGVIADFNSLIAASQLHQTPIFALTAEQIGKVGVVLEAAEGSRDDFGREFEALARRVHCLTAP